MRHFNKFSVKGQTMIEVLLALAIGVIIIAGISKAVNTSLSNSQFSKNQSLANQYAQEGMEIMKNLRPTPDIYSYCLPKGATSLISEDTAVGCPQNVDAFAREVNIQEYAADCGCTEQNPINAKKVTVTVGWSDSKCSIPPTPTTIPPTPTPGGIELSNISGYSSCSSSSISNLNTQFCHRVQLVSCLSAPDVVPTP